MAPPRKKSTELSIPGRDYKVRLPEDVADRIAKKAATEQRPQNRIIINELASVPYLEQRSTFEELIQDMKITLARHGAAIVWHDLSTELLAAVDALLAAEGGEERAAKERLRVIRTAMVLHQRSTRQS
jgi:hypothetical protein